MLSLDDKALQKKGRPCNKLPQVMAGFTVFNKSLPFHRIFRFVAGNWQGVAEFSFFIAG
jgi:hypothetical protein